MTSQDWLAVSIKAPRQTHNSLSLFSSFFTDFHKLLSSKDLSPAEKIASFEIHLQENLFRYVVVLSKKVVSTLESLLYTKFPHSEVEIKPVSELNPTSFEPKIVDFKLKNSVYFPLKTTFSETDDPYLILSALLSKLDHFQEQAIIQLVISPASEGWTHQFIRENFYPLIGWFNNLKVFLANPFLEQDQIDYYQQVKNKYGPKLFHTNLRVAVQAPSAEDLKDKQEVVIFETNS